MDLLKIENELKKRHLYDYTWGRKQSDDWDEKTNFIYKIDTFDELLKNIETFDSDLKNYAMNRWYNFHSAMAVEAIFAMHPNVIPNKNKYDKLVDFKINKIPFDHKTSVFPKGFDNSFDYAQNNVRELIRWLYRNQSNEGRMHFRNRLFIVLYDSINFEHWKLKAELTMLESVIDNYINNFVFKNVQMFHLKDGTKVFSDVIWMIK